MASSQRVLGLALTAILLSGCSAPAPATVTQGTDAPASSAAAPQTSVAAPAGDSGTDEFVSKLSTAMAGVKTYSFDIDMETEVSGQAAVIKTKGVLDQTDAANKKMQMDANIAGMAMKMLQVDGELYVQMEVLGDKWMLVPEDQRSNYMEATKTGDMAKSFEQSKDLIKSLETVGDETVDGVATKHYLVTYDGSALSGLTGGTGSVEGTLEYHMWVDADSLIRKVSMEAAASEDSEVVPFKMSGTMGDYNEPVTIKAPSKDDITEMPS
ncbi:MAG TPA: LppX_LprAFG lipoprotein [Propionicimonas sp.]|nr:LppX_LprAFG lipoprotein [Propionicimonas sp.]HQA77199.1 LppX_LprAFG lipoprotein [Propionicimonas sp.]HQD96851.1 LppX_LprAFG lipoprotein [Propionicimonas sp.]